MRDLVAAFDRNFEYFVAVKRSRGILDTNLYWDATRKVLDHTGKVPIAFRTDPSLLANVAALEARQPSLEFRPSTCRFIQNRPRLRESYVQQAHFGEMALSVPYRAAQVLLIGADAPAVSLWTGLLFVSILFHHSNLRLPLGLERLLVRVLVTPRMHGIHHSERRSEVHTNFASLLTAWDALHRTLRLDVPQETVVIGVPGYRDRRLLDLPLVLALPFQRQREYWPGQA